MGLLDPPALSPAVAAATFASRSQLDAVVGSLAVRAAACSLGDSITAAGYIGPGQFSFAWWNQFSISTQNRIRFDAVYATPGFTIQEIRDTHLPSVIAKSPKYGSCWVMAGTNNMLSAWDFPVMKVAYQEILDALIAAYILPVIVTIPPNNGSAQKRQRITIWNAYLRNLAQLKGYPLLDAHAVLTDATTGAYKTGLFQDDDHPNAAGNAAIASLAASDTQLIGRFPLGQPYLTHGADDGVNLVTAGLFVADGDANGVGNSWLNTGIGTAGSGSLVADANVLGNYQRIRKTSGQTGQVLIYQDIAVGAALTGCAAVAATDTFTKNAHGMTDGQKLFFTTAVAGVDTATAYYARDTATNTFKVALTPGGAAVDVTADGTAAVVVATRWNDGDQIQLAGKIRLEGETSNVVTASLGSLCTFQVQCRNAAGTGLKTISPFNGINVPLAGVTSSFGEVPAGTTTLRVQVIVNGTAAQDLHLDIGQVTITNLTQLGIAL